jgi:hypothetical protein
MYARRHVERLAGEVRRVGTHVGDQAHRAFARDLHTFVQLLGCAHRPLGAEPEPRGGRLLHRRGDERGRRAAAGPLGLDRLDRVGRRRVDRPGHGPQEPGRPLAVGISRARSTPDLAQPRQPAISSDAVRPALRRSAAWMLRRCGLRTCPPRPRPAPPGCASCSPSQAFCILSVGGLPLSSLRAMNAANSGEPAACGLREREVRLQRPVLVRDERADLTLALDDQSHRDATARARPRARGRPSSTEAARPGTRRCGRGSAAPAGR